MAKEGVVAIATGDKIRAMEIATGVAITLLELISHLLLGDRRAIPFAIR